MGHGILISQLEDRVRRIEHHLDLPPPRDRLIAQSLLIAQSSLEHFHPDWDRRPTCHRPPFVIARSACDEAIPPSAGDCFVASAPRNDRGAFPARLKML